MASHDARTDSGEIGLRPQVQTCTVWGPPCRGIVPTACHPDADPVGPGGHGRKLAERLLAESMKGRVIRSAPCPVHLMTDHPDREGGAA